MMNDIEDSVEAMSAVLDYLEEEHKYYPTESEVEEEGFKSMPFWVCHHLAVYDNCFVSNELFYKIAKDLKEFFGEKNFEVMRSETGGFVIWAR